VQTCLFGGGKAVGDPPRDPMSEDAHWAMMDGGGVQTADPYRRIGARSERAKERQR